MYEYQLNVKLNLHFNKEMHVQRWNDNLKVYDRRSSKEIEWNEWAIGTHQLLWDVRQHS